MLSALILLTGSIIVEGYLELPDSPKFGVAPEMPRIIDSSPVPELRENNEVCYPWERHRLLGQWIDYAVQYPRRICQPLIYHTTAACEMAAEGKRGEMRALHRQEVAKLQALQAGKWQWWEVASIAAGMVVLGGLGGYLAGQYVVP
ncbi:MAG: hypothetical protein AMJ46_12700 [Latescibacteria bacterium DG_63]|nr:MAG: hypothetical protein AMJ46_12700 [Latescibacteria bacterium DG_63]